MYNNGKLYIIVPLNWLLQPASWNFQLGSIHVGVGVWRGNRDQTHKNSVTAIYAKPALFCITTSQAWPKEQNLKHNIAILLPSFWQKQENQIIISLVIPSCFVCLNAAKNQFRKLDLCFANPFPSIITLNGNHLNIS